MDNDALLGPTAKSNHSSVNTSRFIVINLSFDECIGDLAQIVISNEDRGRIAYNPEVR